MGKAIRPGTEQLQVKEVEARTGLYQALKTLAIIVGVLIFGWLVLYALSFAITLALALFLYADGRRILKGERWDRDDSLIFTAGDIEVVTGKKRETIKRENIKLEIPGEKANGTSHAIQATVLIIYCLVFPSSFAWINMLRVASIAVCILEAAYHLQSTLTRRPVVEKVLRFALLIPATYIILRIAGWFSII